ncbi:NADP-dependent oxidoreductase [Microbaculum marinisediminis]|uniref:NADP-dependent oxidoreductase n=1 Tax=Microbaculum marinisediminis TaxID=2931392 RepID=A0AAW5R5C7_9HYPH|nr:NADP-dependent oxidoreductase [Microbaculum sp. A6E488]MCT8974322.1 NADP-dependent oxidoreductase [Microbaculum sp. A6E488]
MAIGGRNQQICLRARPTGRLDGSCFGSRSVDVPVPGEDEILVGIEYVSVDPFMRGHMVGVYDHIAPQRLDEPVFAGAVGKVIRSRSSRFREGDVVEGYFGWQQYAAVGAGEARRVPESTLPVSTALGVLGMTGMTAYFGMLDVGRPVAGETVVVSGAAGAVGSVAGQIARLKGCRTVGIVGSNEKAEYIIRKLGFDAAINHRTALDLHENLKEACPDRIDLYFDNVGGRTFDAVTRWMNVGCRYVVCGQIAQYEDDELDRGPRNLKNFEIKRARLEGFRVLDYRARYQEGLAALAKWIEERRIRYDETVFEGLDSAPMALLSLFEGRHIGKVVVRVG